MQNIRKAKKKKIITIPKNVQQLAQDKLHQISIFAEDKFEDESQLLSLEHRTQTQQHQKDITMDQEIQKIIRNKRITWNHHPVKRQRKYSAECKDISHPMGHSQLLILNKLESNAVFVGFKSQNQTAHHKKVKETHCLLLEKRKRISTCPTPSFETKVLISSQSKGASKERNGYLRVGQNTDHSRKSSLSRSMDWKIRHKSKQNLFWLKKKMASTFYPN